MDRTEVSQAVEKLERFRKGNDEDLTEDQQLLQEMADKLVKMMKQDHHLAGAFATMQRTRQAYYVSHAALLRRLKAAGLEPEEPLSRFAVISANDQARLEKITVRKLLGHLGGEILEWLGDECTALEQASHKAEIEQMKSDRKADVYLEVPFRPEGLVSRSRSLVLVGSAKLVAQALDRIQEVALKLRSGSGMVNVVMRLLDHDPATVNVSKSANRGRTLTEIPFSRWKGAAQSARKLDDSLTRWLRTTHKNRVDVTLVNDLAELLPEPVPGFSRSARALRANRLVRNWADVLLSAVVAGLPGEFAAGDEHLKSLGVYADVGWLRESEGELLVNGSPWIFDQLPEEAADEDQPEEFDVE